MTADSALHILPHRGLDQSLLLAILIGIITLLVFTETLGWVFVGLVVPGYLSSVFIVQPTMGFTICAEAIVTFILVRFVSDILDRTTIWSPYFGRERFFMIVLMSVVVRQNSQVWLLPWVLGYIDRTFGTDYLFDLSEFSSIGLVLVPLVANMFWKINIFKGFMTIGVPVLITYSILNFLLLPYTNLSFSNVEITYDNVALNFLNTPKAYVVLLMGAILAARYNVLYGWDYNGILVPSLLSLAWIQPMSVAITIIEVMILFGTTKLVLASPMLRTVNLEGPRQIVLVFSLSFVLKYIASWIISEFFPHINVIDYFGVGYVITSLITVKMLAKKVIARVILPTVHVSLLAFVVGSLVGFVLEEIAPRDKAQAPVVAERLTTSNTILRSPLGAMAVATVRARATPLAQHEQGRPRRELEQYAELWQHIDGWLVAPTVERERTIRTQAGAMGLAFEELGQGTGEGRKAYVLLEQEERLDRQSGWDTAVLVPGASGPVIEVPRPRTEHAVAELAAVLCEHLECRAILVSGIDSADEGRTAGDALAHARATLFKAVQSMRSVPLVELRVSDHVPAATARLHLHHKLPEQVRLDHLWPRSLDLDLELSWNPPPGPSQSFSARDDAVALFLHPESVWKVLLDHAERAGSEPTRYPRTTLKSWLTATFDQAHVIGASQTLPSQSEVRFIGHLLAARLLDMRPGRLSWLNHLASLIDYQIVVLDDCVDDASCWVLTEVSRPVRHRWGTLAVRVDPPFDPLAVEAPRPIIEKGAWQIAFEMWRQSRGRVLLVGHDLPATQGIPHLDPVRFANVFTPFHAMHEAVHRALYRDTEVTLRPLIVQVRGFGTWRLVLKHVIIGLGPPALEPTQVPSGLERMLTADGFLSWLGEDTDYARGEPEQVTLAGQGNPQLLFTQNTGGVDIALIWFSQPVRQLYLDESIEAASERIETAGFILKQRSALGFLTEEVPARFETVSRGSMRFDDLLDLAMRYALTQDVAILRKLREVSSKDPRIEVAAWWGTEISAPLLALTMAEPGQVRRAVVLLTEFADDCSDISHGTELSRETLKTALIRRCRKISTTYAVRGR